MRHQRNVEGLRQNAQKKRQEAIARTEQGIKQLIRECRPVNFKTVAEIAEVSTAWLYKEPEIKERIEYLREQQTRTKKSVPPQQKATEASKDAKYQALKQRLQKVEAENRGLRDHLEAIHGRHRLLAQENEVQGKEIERLTKLLNEAKAEIEAFKKNSSPKHQTNDYLTSSSSGESTKPKSKVTPLTNRKAARLRISDKLQSKLDGLGIRLNSTLEAAIKSVSEDVALSAIASLHAASASSEVQNPAGFLVAAIKGSWMPNEGYEHKVEMDLFNKWYPIAQSLKLVNAATQIDGVQHVLMAFDEWMPFSKILAKYPLDKLQEMINRER
jgi:hypothetical protein